MAPGVKSPGSGRLLVPPAPSAGTLGGMTDVTRRLFTVEAGVPKSVVQMESPDGLADGSRINGQNTPTSVSGSARG
jgi:hypothetical protein